MRSRRISTLSVGTSRTGGDRDTRRSCTVGLAELTPATVGAAFFMSEVAVALGGILLGVNPFDQPGVEACKRNMFRRLGKPEV